MATQNENIEITADNTHIFEEAMDQAIMRALEAVGLDVESIAADNAPVDTGRLAASITHALDGNEKAVYIGTNVEYAPYQELGTSRIPAANDGKGYLRPAANENKKRIHDIFYAALHG